MRSIWGKLRKVWGQFVDGLTEAQWDAVRAVAILAALAAVGAAGYFLGWPSWKRWQNRRALGEAEAFAQSGDTRSLILALRRATQLEPEDVATWRETARLLDEVNSPDTVLVREQLANIAPLDMNLRLALAQDALKFGRFDTAESAVAGLSAAARRDVAYHRFAASLAASLGRNADLEREIKAILDLEPRDLDSRFAYAALRLWGPDPAARPAARTELEGMLAEPAVRVRAAIELLSEASRGRNPGRVRDVLVLLLARFAPQAAPDFTGPTVPAWRELVDGMKAAASSSPADTALVARWISAMGRRSETVAWLETLPEAVRNSGVVADVEAEICAEQDDLPRLGRLLQNGAWGVWPSNAQTLALAARVQVLRFSDTGGKQTWDDAIGASGNSLTGLKALARLASIWRYSDGEERVLRNILGRNPKIFWAYDGLRTLYIARDDLPRLLDLYGAWSAQLPDDASIAAARIMLGCILNRADPAAIDRAAKLTARDPISVPAKAAYAAALWRGGRSADAWPVLASLPPDTLARPDVSFWTALIQADLGHVAETVAAIRRAAPAASSSEERSLLKAAAAKVGR